jgi:hypothetical protein
MCLTGMVTKNVFLDGKDMIIKQYDTVLWPLLALRDCCFPRHIFVNGRVGLQS